MANINSITSNSYSSSTSSIYGNRNVLTGLASGMDTEAMIQNSVTGYQTKITELQQSTTKLEWKQDAYREIIDQMYNINQKYTSYTSKTNLSSNSFFNNAITTTTQGTNAAAVTATGKAKSDIQINAVTQLATSARYAVDASDLSVATTNSPKGTAIDWSQTDAVGQVKGSMTLKYGSQTIELKFTEKDTFDFADTDTAEQKAEKLKSVIEDKLREIDVTTSKGTVKASGLLNVTVSGNKFTFEENRNSAFDDGSSVYINSVSGNVGELLGASKPTSTENAVKFANDSFTVGNYDKLAKKMTTAEYLSGKTVDVTLDGVTKQIKLGDLKEPDLTSYDNDVVEKKAAMDALASGSDEWLVARTAYLEAEQAKTDAFKSSLNDQLKSSLQASIDKQFGSGKVTVGVDGGALSFNVREGSGSTLKVSSEAGEKLGIGKSGVSNYFNTSKTLQNLQGMEWLNNNARIEAAAGDITIKTDDEGNVTRYDSEGNQVAQNYDDPTGKYYRVNSDGDFLYSMNINGTQIGEFTKDTTLESVLNAINSSADAGVNVSYSNLTSQFVFTARETGEGGKIEFGDGLAKKLFTVNNDPDQLSLEKFFNDKIKWDDEGKASLAFYDPGSGYNRKRLVLSKDMKVQDLVEKIEGLDTRYAGMIQYDEGTGAYSFLNKDGSTMDSEGAGRYKLRQTGSSSNVSFSINDLFSSLATATREAGKDAVIDATVNGKQLTLQRSSNVVNMDGLSVTLKEEFSAYGTDGKLSKADAVTFKTSSNADDIVDTIKGFVEDVNKLMSSVHTAFATQPAEKSSSQHTKYEPLTEDDKKDMSESAIAAYEEKAKQGLLFGDTDLSSLYNKLRDSLQSFGSDRVDMEAIGLSTTYSNGVTTFSLDENKLRSALDGDPDKVRNVFTKTKESGSKTNGLMANLKSTLNAYASTSLGSPGILVRKAGTKLSSLSLLNNNIQKQIDNVNSQIESWQTKLSSKIDYYTKQFTALEKMMSTMNNQSSMLADLMGY